MNTRFSYLYRDACNYKQYHAVILRGTFDPAALTPLLRDREYFIPSEVGLPDLQPSDITDDDHPWHEIEEIAPTPDPPDQACDTAKLLVRFESAHRADWNEPAAMERLGLG